MIWRPDIEQEALDEYQQDADDAQLADEVCECESCGDVFEVYSTDATAREIAIEVWGWKYDDASGGLLCEECVQEREEDTNG